MSGLVNLDAYIEASTLSHFPFHQKVFKAFVSAMLDDEGDIAQEVKRVRDLVSPSDSWFLWRELSKDARAYAGLDYAYAFAYSVQFKNLTLFQVVANLFGLGTVEMRYGPQLYVDVITHTDDIWDRKTDQGFTTDMQDSGFPVVVLALGFAYVEGAGVPLYDEAWGRFVEAAKFFSLVKPAWVSFVALPQPSLVLSRFQSVGVSFCSYSSADFALLDSVSDEEFEGLFTSFTCNSRTDVQTSIKVLSDRRRVVSVFSGSPSEDLTLVSGDARFGNIVFQLAWDDFGELVTISGQSRIYLAQVLVNFSASGDNDTYA